MRILLGCLNVNGLGGSELYHYELARELALTGNSIDLFTLRNIDYTDQVRAKLLKLDINQVDLRTIDTSKEYGIIVVSQPEVNQFVLNNFNNTPIISIIHSEIRSETPVVDSRISHYIGIRQPIVDMLVNEYGIPKEKVSLIYNPIDTSRFKPADKKQTDKVRGLFVGEVLDPIRFQTVSHLVQSCVENDWELLIMSDSRYDFNHPNITYIDKRWNTEEIVKYVDFTGGILLGRTTLEGLCCNVPGYVYHIDIQGSILSIELVEPRELPKLCDSTYVAKQHLHLYNKLIQK
jgi:hypothetical protein